MHLILLTILRRISISVSMCVCVCGGAQVETGNGGREAIVDFVKQDMGGALDKVPDDGMCLCLCLCLSLSSVYVFVHVSGLCCVSVSLSVSV